MSTVFKGRDHYFDPQDRVYFLSDTFFVGNVFYLERVILGPNLSTVDGFENQVFGSYNTVVGNLNLVAGSYNNLSGANSFVAGVNNLVTGNNTTVVGAHNLATHDNAFVVGAYNDANVASNVIFAIGAGTSDTGRYNALTLTSGGELLVNNLVTVKPISLQPNQDGALILRGKQYGLDLLGDDLLLHSGNLLTLVNANIGPDGNLVYANGVYLDAIGRFGVGVIPNSAATFQVLGDTLMQGSVTVANAANIPTLYSDSATIASLKATNLSPTWPTWAPSGLVSPTCQL